MSAETPFTQKPPVTKVYINKSVRKDVDDDIPANLQKSFCPGPVVPPWGGGGGWVSMA